MNKNMPVVILCGGYGTRMKEESEYRPKPLSLVGGKPLLWHIMRIYAKFGYKEFILPLGYKGWMIKDYFLNYNDFSNNFSLEMSPACCKKTYIDFNDSIDYTIHFIETGLDAQTGSRLKAVADLLPETFMLTYGDGVSDVNIDKLVDFHFSHGKILTVTGVEEPPRFGSIHHENNCIKVFNEKKTSSPGLVNSGFFVINKKFLDYIDDRSNIKLELEPIQAAVSNNEAMVFCHKGRWVCGDLLREIENMNYLCEKGDAFWLC